MNTAKTSKPVPAFSSSPVAVPVDASKAVVGKDKGRVDIPRPTPPGMQKNSKGDVTAPAKSAESAESAETTRKVYEEQMQNLKVHHVQVRLALLL